MDINVIEQEFTKDEMILLKVFLGRNSRLLEEELLELKKKITETDCSQTKKRFELRYSSLELLENAIEKLFLLIKD